MSSNETFSDTTAAPAETAKTPCIGICSTTSVGDAVCRGCKRYAVEVINWHSYDDIAKRAVLSRIEQMIVQILEDKLRIFSLPNLQHGLNQFNIPFDPALSPYCWLHNLLKKAHQHIESLEEYGVYLRPDYADHNVNELCELIDTELMLLSDAHYERYIALNRQSTCA
ncbi:MAG: DUF1289 domain-containing protein [Pseudohongiellaceae bacterium]